jgi:hypothetical protein
MKIKSQEKKELKEVTVGNNSSSSNILLFENGSKRLL